MEHLTHAEKEQMMHELKVITLMSAAEIENYCRVHKLPFGSLKQWYLTTCRLPTDKEIEAINKDIRLALFLWQREQIKLNIDKYDDLLKKFI